MPVRAKAPIKITQITLRRQFKLWKKNSPIRMKGAFSFGGNATSGLSGKPEGKKEKWGDVENKTGTLVKKKEEKWKETMIQFTLK